MSTLLIAVGAGLAFVIAYHTYGRWLGSKLFRLSAATVCPSHRLADGSDYVPTSRFVVFGHHFTSIAATGPIVGPAIAVMWGWLPALLWVVLGSIFIGAVHDFGALVVSLRNNGQTVGDIAGRVLNRRVRILFLCVLFLALTIIIAIFGLVIAAVFRQYPAAIFPVLVQIPIAIVIGLWLHRKGANLVIPSIIALALMYLAVYYGDTNFNVALPAFGWEAGEWGLHAVNAWFAAWPTIVWVGVLLVYCYIASVLPVWTLLQPRDFINALQLIGTLALIVFGLIWAAFMGGAPPVEGASRQPLEIAAPMINWNPQGAPLLVPFLFITIACGAISGFHCLVSSGTSSKQMSTEADAQFVGYGSMLTEGFLATIVILACVAGLGLGIEMPRNLFNSSGGTISVDSPNASGRQRQKTFRLSPRPMATFDAPNNDPRDLQLYEREVTFRDSETGHVIREERTHEVIVGNWDAWRASWTPKPHRYLRDEATFVDAYDFWVGPGDDPKMAIVGSYAFNTRYTNWTEAGGLARTVGAFVDGAGNFLKALGIPPMIAVALVGVFVASFAATTLDSATRLQRYVIQELGKALTGRGSGGGDGGGSGGGPRCGYCDYDLSYNVSGICPECGTEIDQTFPSPNPSHRAGSKASPSPNPSQREGSVESPSLREGSGEGGAHLRDSITENGHTHFNQQMTDNMPSVKEPRAWTADALNPFAWLMNKYIATLAAVVVAGLIAALPAPGQSWTWATAGGGGMILWPMFGATNQLMAGLAFMVIAFWLWRRKLPIFFIVLPLIFMLIMPAWAMLYQVFWANPGGEPGWLFSDTPNWPLIFIALATVGLEIWMIAEALLLFPKVRGVLEEQLAGNPSGGLPAETATAPGTAPATPATRAGIESA